MPERVKGKERQLPTKRKQLNNNSSNRLGDKIFEQAAGFLRIADAENPLDNSAVHPERYALVEQMAKDQNVSVNELLKSKEVRKKIDLKKEFRKK